MSDQHSDDDSAQNGKAGEVSRLAKYIKQGSKERAATRIKCLDNVSEII